MSLRCRQIVISRAGRDPHHSRERPNSRLPTNEPSIALLQAQHRVHARNRRDTAGNLRLATRHHLTIVHSTFFLWNILATIRPRIARDSLTFCMCRGPSRWCSDLWALRAPAKEVTSSLLPLFTAILEAAPQAGITSASLITNALVPAVTK